MQVVVPLMQFTLLFNLLTLFLKCYLLSSFNSDVVKMFVLSCCLDPFEPVSCAFVCFRLEKQFYFRTSYMRIKEKLEIFPFVQNRPYMY
jgi:hypothetical protein